MSVKVNAEIVMKNFRGGKWWPPCIPVYDSFVPCWCGQWECHATLKQTYTVDLVQVPKQEIKSFAIGWGRSFTVCSQHAERCNSCLLILDLVWAVVSAWRAWALYCYPVRTWCILMRALTPLCRFHWCAFYQYVQFKTFIYSSLSISANC